MSTCSAFKRLSSFYHFPRAIMITTLYVFLDSISAFGLPRSWRGNADQLVFNIALG